jgi:lipopolysaccharide transport system permease protein
MPARAPKHLAQPPPHEREIGPDPDPGHASGGLGELWRQRRLVLAFVMNDLRQRYTGSSIGFFWSVVTPLLELATYTFVFHVVLGLRTDRGLSASDGGLSHYALFLFCGMITWFGVQEGLTRATSAITDHGHLIKKVNFHAIALPGYVVISALFNQVIRLGVLSAALLLFTPEGLSWHMALVPLVLVVQGAFVLGAGLLLATLNVYFKDTLHIVKAGLLLWMFVTPIFYAPDAYPPRFNLLLQLNPLAHLVGVYRQLALQHVIPHPHNLLVVGVMATFSLLVGYSVFHHHQDQFADHV